MEAVRLKLGMHPVDLASLPAVEVAFLVGKVSFTVMEVAFLDRWASLPVVKAAFLVK